MHISSSRASAEYYIVQHFAFCSLYCCGYESCMKASLRLYLCKDWLEGVIRLKAYTETHSCLTPCGDFINKSGSVSELGCSWAVAGL